MIISTYTYVDNNLPIKVWFLGHIHAKINWDQYIGILGPHRSSRKSSLQRETNTLLTGQRASQQKHGQIFLTSHSMQTLQFTKTVANLVTG